MKRITFRELLNLIHEGKQPNKVYLSGTNLEWEWDSVDEEYYWQDFNGGIEFVTLGELVSNRFTGKQLAEKKIIDFFDDILTDKEKAYLSNLIKPFKKYVYCIEKIKEQKQERICISYADYLERVKGQEVYRFIFLPTFKAGTMYKGMELFKEYTLEELGL